MAISKPTILIHASDNVSRLKAAVLCGADINEQTGSELRTPLMQAALVGAEKCLQHLISIGAGIEDKSSKGWTAIHYAILGNFPGCLTMLIRAGADTHGVTFEGKGIIEFAGSMNRSACTEVLRRTHFEYEEARRTLHLSTKMTDIAGDFSAETDDVSLHCARLEQAALMAVTDQDHSRLQRVIKAGLTVDFLDHEGETLLMKAAAWGAYPCMEVLLASGARADMKDDRGQTVLMHAVMGSRPRSVLLLLQNKVPLEPINKHGQCAFDLAISLRRSTCAELISVAAYGGLPSLKHDVLEGALAASN